MGIVQQDVFLFPGSFRENIAYGRFDATPAEIVYVLPNNKNIIMAAQQTIPLCEDKKVIVLPTKTVPQGISAMLCADPDAEEADNTAAMTEGFSYVRTSEITYAARDSDFGGFAIRQGDYLALEEHQLFGTDQDLSAMLDRLAQAAGMEDIIALESAISETELQIEQLTGSLRKYDSLVGYSTIHLYLWEVYRLSTDEEVPVTFGQRLGAAFSTGFQRGVDGLEDFVITVARNWLSLLVFAAVATIVVLVLIRWRRARRRKAAVPPPQSEDKKE